MKILVVSDTHGNEEILKQLKLKHYDVDYFLHLGDSCLPKSKIDGYATVKGNCDFENYPIKLDFKINEVTIHMEHGDGFLFGFDPNKYISSLNTNIFLFGHTHQKLATKVGETFVFNPGSATRPRDSKKGSYLIIQLNDNTIESYKFYDIN